MAKGVLRGNGMSANVAVVGGSAWIDASLDRRESKRYDFLRAATVYRGASRQVGVARDLSENGLFLYSDFQPTIGEQLHVIVESSPRSIRVTGTVVRLERDRSYNNIGLAIRITKSFLLQPFIEDVFLSQAA